MGKRITDKERLDFLSARSVNVIRQVMWKGKRVHRKKPPVFVDFIERGDGIYNMVGRHFYSLRVAIDAAIRAKRKGGSK